MLAKPIPVPPQGTQLEWRLDPPYSAKHLLIVIAMLAALLPLATLAGTFPDGDTVIQDGDEVFFVAALRWTAWSR